MSVKIRQEYQPLLADAVKAAQSGLRPLTPFKPSVHSTIGVAFDGGVLTAIENVQNAADTDAGEDGSSVLACGHGDVWAESGTCMACEPAVGPQSSQGIERPDVYGRDPLQ